MRRVVIAFAALACAQYAVAQQPAGPSLATAAREAAKGYKPVSPEAINQAKADAQKAMSDLDAFLRTGAKYKVDGWKRYLQWDQLAAGVSDGQATIVSPIADKLRANLTGLERPEYMRLRDALTRYAAVLKAASGTKAQEDYPQRLEDLAAQLDTYGKDPAAGDAALSIGRTLTWLNDAHQAPELVDSIRRAYGRPNFFGHASKRLVAASYERDIDQVTAVNDNILGTSLHGTARMVGQTSLLLDENPDQASMNLLLTGTAWSNNVGYNGPVTIYTTGTTSVSARKNIYMTAEGLSSYAAAASCATSSNINDICAKCGLIERVAWKRAGQQKGQAEVIGSQHASWRVAGQLDAEAGRQLKEQNDRYLEKIRNPLLRKGEFPEEMRFSSTREQVRLQSLQESPGFLAAPNDPPNFSSEHDLAAQMHESAVTNYGEGILGGYELTDVRLEKLIKDDLKADLPEELRVTKPDGTIDQEKDAWSIIFAKSLPVRAKFNANGVWMAIRADGFTRGEGDVPGGKYKPALTELVEISAQYKLEKTAQGATMRRDGDVRVRFPNRANPDQVTLRDNAIVTFIRRKFRNLFKEEFVGEGITFKGEMAKIGRLRLGEIDADGAWLRLGWDMTLENSAPAIAAGGGEQ